MRLLLTYVCMCVSVRASPCMCCVQVQCAQAAAHNVLAEPLASLKKTQWNGDEHPQTAASCMQQPTNLCNIIQDPSRSHAETMIGRV